MNQNKKTNMKHPIEINNKDHGKIELGYNLEVERKDKESNEKGGFDFVPKDYHWTNSEEQKIKTAEIEEKTK